MINLTKHTDTQLLKLLNDNKEKHDNLKKEIVDDTYEFDNYVIEKTNEINQKIKRLEELEKNYISLIEELNNRDAIR
jgi:Mg2+ and Co2+ transporter CorA